MKNAIQLRDDGSYYLTANGCEMTLQKDGERWAMYSVNAVVKAYRNGYAIPKYFDTLDDVEARYKSWRGIAALAS